MQFNSVQFLFCFLPLFLAVYYIAPRKLRNGILTLGSLIFYWYAGDEHGLTMGCLLYFTVMTFLLGRIMEKRPSRGAMVFGWCVLIAALVILKCYDGGTHLAPGMSFYIFQMCAYLADVHHSVMPAEKNLLAYSSQILMFPKLLSGPLTDPGELRRQSREPQVCCQWFHRGLQELILGLSMKVMLANRLGGLWSQAGVIGYESISAGFAWMSLVAYAMRLYFDFWGYSLMAMGLGHMLGYDLPENFLDPYAAKSVSQFYRRWHATLGAWFRNYIYIPLGGNRRGTLRTILNLSVVWLLTGFWHGVGGNYLLWAGILLVCILNERLWLGKLLKKSHVLCHVYTVGVILLSWVPFAVGDFEQMLIFFGRLFCRGGEVLNPQDYLIWGESYLPLLATGAIMATPLPRWLWKKIRDWPIVDVALFVLFWLAIYTIATSAQDPFLYFQY